MRRLFGMARPSVPLVLVIACYATLLAIVGRGIADRVSHPEPARLSISDPCDLLDGDTVTAVLGEPALDPTSFDPGSFKPKASNLLARAEYPLGTLEDELLVRAWGCKWSQPIRSSEDWDYQGRSLSITVRRYESARVARAMFDQVSRGLLFELPGADTALRETILEELSWRRGRPATERARVDVTARDGTLVVEVSVRSGDVRYEAKPRAIAQRLLTREEGRAYAERVAREVVQRP